MSNNRILWTFVSLVIFASPVLTLAEGSWPQWRGPNRDGKSSEMGLLDEFKPDGPPLVWQSEGLGSGYSSIAIADGKIFTLGRRGKQEQLIALSQETGSEIWAAEIASLASYPSSGDLLVNGAWFKEGRVVVFESQTSSHGGLGGAQTEAFLVAPVGWGTRAEDRKTPESLHLLIKQQLVRMRSVPAPTSGRG